ncbi:MAG: LuxR C-terminal-related transcriptional regulator [Bacteroidales bacterium]
MDDSELQATYHHLISNNQKLDGNPDYSRVKQLFNTLEQLAVTGNSAVSVFDFFKQRHIFYSSNYAEFLGLEPGPFTEERQSSATSLIHPEDRVRLDANGVLLLKLFYNLPVEERKSFKLINDFRMKGVGGQYRRMIEQHQVLENGPGGTLWLTMSILDVSPDDDNSAPVRSRLYHLGTGEFIPFEEEFSRIDNPQVPQLTSREQEILKLVSDGLLSKEISARLGISLHTVNTHRQRVLEKLSANNSLEAIRFAREYGLI